ncbi:hypothetical protein AGMMS49546_37420 [Spirochaetia bacterium]|nr:hypothetical protein AGMMS49546_37420 [Spirochaetia bacterium]
MGKSLKSGKMTEILSDRFSNLWQLFSETAFFIGRTGEFDQYENQLRRLRLKLQQARNDKTYHGDIRAEIVEIRRSLRMQGYDLSLAKHTIEFDGFRHDDSTAEGFRRVVLFITDTDIFTITGDENHITLAEFLDRKIERYQGKFHIRSRHYLWYRRRGKELTLSGADTETKDDYERLKAMAEVNQLFFAGKLRKLV